MSARGVHFAVTATQEKALLAARSDRKVMALVEEIEEAWEEPFVCETDAAWDAIHRCLTDGTLLYVSGKYPLNHCVCGGRQLFRGRDYTVAYVSARQVKDVAKALPKITKAWWPRCSGAAGSRSTTGRHRDAASRSSWVSPE